MEKKNIQLDLNPDLTLSNNNKPENETYLQFLVNCQDTPCETGNVPGKPGHLVTQVFGHAELSSTNTAAGISD